MTLPSYCRDGLEVSSGDLAQALKIVARGIGKYLGDASLGFGEKFLSIEAGNTAAKVPAAGVWPGTIFVDASWVRRMAKRMPVGDPIYLRVAEGRIYANRYSEACALAAREPPVNPELPPVDEQHLIDAAARILKPLYIKRADLEDLISEARANRTASWSRDEKKTIAIIAKAWLLLAQLGIETADLRRLMDKSIRDAWK